MKKFLRTLVIIILLVIAFFLIKKNTTRLGSIDNSILLTGVIETGINATTGDITETGSTVPTQTGEINTAITTNQGYLTEAYTSGSKNYLKIDYIEYGPQGPGGAPEIINNNPLIRTFEVANTATFEVLKNVPNEGPKPVSILRNEFVNRVNKDRNILNPDINAPIYYGAGNISIVKITHDSQKIYTVTETYRP